MKECSDSACLPWNGDHEALNRDDGVFYGTLMRGVEFRRRLLMVETDYVETAAWLQELGVGIVRNARMWTYVAAAIAYHFAELLMVQDALWSEFEVLEFWRDHHGRLNRARSLPYALMYFYGSHQGQIAERARDHARALSRLMLEGVQAFWIPSILNSKGGFKAMKAESKRETPAQKAVVVDEAYCLRNIKLSLTNSQAQTFDSLTTDDMITIRLGAKSLFVVVRVDAASNNIYPDI